MSPNDAPNPFEAPVTPGFEGESPEDEPSGPPWEQSGDIFTRYVRTAIAILVHPSDTFEKIRPTENVSAARNFFGFGYLLFFILLLALSLLINVFSDRPLLGIDGMMTFTAVGGVLSIVIAYLYALFVHGCLILFGAAKRRYEATIRTFAYSFGSTILWLLIPVVGPMLMVQVFYILMVGLAKMHGVSMIRTLLALLLSLVVIAVCLGAVGELGQTTQTTFERVEPAIRIDR
jgi:hypothetical protein